MDTHLCFWVKYIFSARHAGRCKHRPLQTIYRFAANIYASPRRGEGTPPYRCFVGLQHIIKCSVRNGLDRSLQIVFQLVPISIKPTSKRRTTRWFCVMRLYLSFVFYYIFGSFFSKKEHKSSVKPLTAFPGTRHRWWPAGGVCFRGYRSCARHCAGAAPRAG